MAGDANGQLPQQEPGFCGRIGGGGKGLTSRHATRVSTDRRNINLEGQGRKRLGATMTQSITLQILRRSESGTRWDAGNHSQSQELLLLRFDWTQLSIARVANPLRH